MHDRDAELTFELPSVGNDESLRELRLDAELRQHGTRYPRILASCIDEGILHRSHLTATLGALDDDRRAKGSHVAHDTLRSVRVSHRSHATRRGRLPHAWT